MSEVIFRFNPAVKAVGIFYVQQIQTLFEVFFTSVPSHID